MHHVTERWQDGQNARDQNFATGQRLKVGAASDRGVRGQRFIAAGHNLPGKAGVVDAAGVLGQDTDGAVALQFQFHAQEMRSVFAQSAAILLRLAAWPQAAPHLPTRPRNKIVFRVINSS